MAEPAPERFNAVVREFLVNLSTSFPDDASFVDALDQFDALCVLSADTPLKTFRTAVSVSDHATLISARDPAVFGLVAVPGLDFRALWARNLSDAERAALWGYLHWMLRIAFE